MMPIPTPLTSKQTISYHNWKKVDLYKFKLNITNKLVFPEGSSVDDKVQQYNTILTELADTHAPMQTRTVTLRPHHPWFTDEVKEAKQLRRKLERQWLSSGLTIHLEMFKHQRNHVTKLIQESKTEYFSAKINDAHDQKELFNLTNKLMHKVKCTKLPTHTSDEELANRFADFFTDKISRIRTDIEQSRVPHVPDYMPICNVVLSDIPLATTKSVTSLIQKSPAKSCQLDPIPTSVLKSCVEVLAPAVTAIVNESVSTGVVPCSLKQALVTPLIKKSTLNADVLKNYRPVSNLPFLSKIIEKHVDHYFGIHDDANDLNDPHQSAYTKGASTETALLKVQNDLLLAVDSKKAALLILLDLSAAFDTIDHKILLSRLDKNFGIRGTALSWVQSYLSDRLQYIVVNGSKSTAKPLLHGVPQGSNFGPKAFKRYDRPVGIIAKKYRLEYHIYADDTQLYVSFKPHDESVRSRGT